MRRVVTANDKGGLAHVAVDESVAPLEHLIPPNVEPHRIFRLWGADGVPMVPWDGTETHGAALFAPTPGFRVMLVEQPSLPAGALEKIMSGDVDMTRADDVVEGVGATRDHSEPGMHATDTVDVILVIDGELTLELDRDETVVLRSGDSVVQNGTRHRWTNRSAAPVRYLAMMFGADRTVAGATPDERDPS